MTRIILIRHGQSQANAASLFAGLSDFDLTELGHRQAALAAEYLRPRERVDRIYSSDLLRAYHTALPFGAAYGLPVEKDEGLREIFGGDWERLSFPQIAEQYPDAFDVWVNDYSHSRPVNGESTEEVYRRVVPHICALAEENDGKCILLATHATVVRAFHAFAEGLRADETGSVPFAHNASINIFSYEKGRAHPVSLNLVEHLGDGVTSLPFKPNA